MVGWDELRTSWLRSLRARNLSERTITIYDTAARAWMNAATTKPADFDRGELEQFLADHAATHTPGGTSQLFRALQQWFRWLAAEEEVVPNPFDRLGRPLVPPVPIPLLTVEQLHALFGTCQGRSFPDRRDNAILRLLLDSGCRRGELAALTNEDVDLDAQRATVLGKGRKVRTIGFGARTAEALDRYLRMRGHHDGPLWLAYNKRQPMSDNAIHLMIRRRGEQAGIDGLHAHVLRHQMAHLWMMSGGSENDLMVLAGWSSRSMLSRYGASGAAERALDAARRNSVGDRF